MHVLLVLGRMGTLLFIVAVSTVFLVVRLAVEVALHAHYRQLLLGIVCGHVNVHASQTFNLHIILTSEDLL